DKQIDGVTLNVNAASTVTGIINILGGDMFVTGQGTIGSPTAINIMSGGITTPALTQAQFELMNTAAASNSNRVGDATAINLNSGRFAFTGAGTNGTQAFAE